MKSISIFKVNAGLLTIILTGVILYYGKEFLVPLFFAILLSMLLLPVCRRLERWGVGRIWSTLAGALIIVLLVAGLFGIIIAQGASISEDLPQMQVQAEKLFEQLQQWVQARYGMGKQEQLSYLQKGVDKLSSSGSQLAADFLSGAMGFLTGFVLILLYFFFLMWKREKYREFFLKLVAEENRREMGRELDEISRVAGQYLIGRLVSMAFLAVFYMIGFSVVGMENALLIAMVAVLPTLVPYVGAFVGGFFPLAMAMLSGSSEMIMPVVIILVVAQAIDNNIIEPLVEGESLNISPIFTIIGIVLGGILWGVAGMILFIPMFAILKIICDHIPALHPYSFLLKNDIGESKWMEKIKGWFGK